jgi:hypothetical protein
MKKSNIGITVKIIIIKVFTAKRSLSRIPSIKAIAIFITG